MISIVGDEKLPNNEKPEKNKSKLKFVVQLDLNFSFHLQLYHSGRSFCQETTRIYRQRSKSKYQTRSRTISNQVNRKRFGMFASIFFENTRLSFQDQAASSNQRVTPAVFLPVSISYQWHRLSMNILAFL